jgi:sRNA-binding carbon storage regulator CsrA
VAPKEVPVHRQEVFEAIHGKDQTDAPPPAMVVNKTGDVPGRAV